MMQRLLLFPLPPSVLLVPDVTWILLTVGFPEGMHFVVIKGLELLFLVLWVHLVGARSLRVEFLLVIHIVVLEVLLNQVIILLSIRLV